MFVKTLKDLFSTSRLLALEMKPLLMVSEKKFKRFLSYRIKLFKRVSSDFSLHDKLKSANKKNIRTFSTTNVENNRSQWYKTKAENKFLQMLLFLYFLQSVT